MAPLRRLRGRCRDRPRHRLPAAAPAAAAAGERRRPGAGVRLSAPDAPGGGELPLSHALALGALQGPTEVLPVSSSGHLVLVPALLDLPYAGLDPELRKSFEVALHVGTVAGLLVALRGRLVRDARGIGPRGLLRLPLTFAPAAVAGLAFERSIERRLGTPRVVAAAQVAAGLALWLADRHGGGRPLAAATATDALWVGAAQAAALLPGVSRAGATLTAARARGFGRVAASGLAREAALPVIAGAAVLKGVRLRRRGLPAQLQAPFIGGVAAAAASTIAAARLTGVLEGRRSLAPVAAYRVALGVVALARLRPTRPAHGVESRT